MENLNGETVKRTYALRARKLSFDRFRLRLVEDLYYHARTMTMFEGDLPQIIISKNVKLAGRSNPAGGGSM
jgi:hypothetical protein